MSEDSGRPVVMALDDSKVQLMAYERLFASLLELNGLLLQAFLKPREAMDRLAFMKTIGRKPCLFLLDLKMEEISGLDFLTYLKADPALSSIPVVIATGSSEVEDVRKSLLLGAKDFLVKPIKTSLFSAKILKWTSQGDPNPSVHPA